MEFPQRIATQQLIHIFTAVILMLGGSASAEEMEQTFDDVRQETQVWTTYAISPLLRAHNLSVSVHKGSAVISGKVGDGISKELAEQIAFGVKGIKNVNNKIVVEKDYAAPAMDADKNYGITVENASISAAVRSKLFWSKYANGLDVDVSTHSGKVTLKGTAVSHNFKSMASRITRNTRGVIAVDNQLSVIEKDSEMNANMKNSANSVSESISDSWITAKVKTTYMYSSNVSSNDISVKTVAGVVVLDGKVDSAVERSLAVELAENVRGVKRVVSKSLVY